MKLLNKNNIIKNQVNTVEQYKVLNYLKDTFNTDYIAIYLVDRYTIKVIDTNNDIGYFKYNNKTKNIDFIDNYNKSKEMERWKNEKNKDETKNLNKYELLKLDYLKKNNKVLYQRLIIEDKLNTFLFSVGKEAEEKLKFLINELAEKDKDLNENLKEENQLLWVQKMNNYKNIAEEIVLKELIFNEKVWGQIE